MEAHETSWCCGSGGEEYDLLTDLHVIQNFV